MGEQDINLDDLQRDIKAAERYMSTGRDGVSSSGGGGGGRADMDQERRANILQQFGRQPLGAPSPSAARYAAVRGSSSGGVASSGYTDANTGRVHDDDDDAGSVGSVSSRYSTAEEREHLINRLLKEHRARKSGDVCTPPRRGMGDTLRDPLQTGGSRGGEQSAPSSPDRVLMRADYDDGDDGDGDGGNTLFFASDLGLPTRGVRKGGGRTGEAKRNSSMERTARPHTAHTARTAGGTGAARLNGPVRSASVERCRPAWGARPARTRKTSLSPTPRARASAPAPTVSAREQALCDVSRSRGRGAVGWSNAVGPLVSALGLTGPKKHLKSREVVIMTIAAHS